MRGVGRQAMTRLICLPWRGSLWLVWGAGAQAVARPVKGRDMTQDEILHRLENLRIEHRDLDHAIHVLIEASIPDQLRIARLKKRKLLLKDEISWLEDQLVPDIIA